MVDGRTLSADETAIRKIVEDWADAVRRRDLPAVLLNHSTDMLIFDVPPPFSSRGIDAYAKTWEQFFGWAVTPAVFDIKEMAVTSGSDVAFVSAAMRCAGTESDGTRLDLDFRLTIGLRKIGGHWTIVHEHHSVPAT
jgi:uncharacterized protein (TIGR02246 family)